MTVPDQPRGHGTLPPIVIGSAMGLTMKLSARLEWAPTWLMIAEERVAAAISARLVGPAALAQEFHASVMAISASAAAVEAQRKQSITGDATPLTKPPKRLLPDGRQRGSNKGARLGQYLVERGAIDSDLAQALGRLFDLRNDSLHPYSDFEEPIPHPTGVDVSPEVAIYNADEAMESLRVAQEVTKALADLEGGRDG